MLTVIVTPHTKLALVLNNTLLLANRKICGLLVAASLELIGVSLEGVRYKIGLHGFAMHIKVLGVVIEHFVNGNTTISSLILGLYHVLGNICSRLKAWRVGLSVHQHLLLLFLQ